MHCFIYEMYYGNDFEVSSDDFLKHIDSLKFEEDFHVVYSSNREEGKSIKNISLIRFYVGNDCVGYICD